MGEWSFLKRISRFDTTMDCKTLGDYENMIAKTSCQHCGEHIAFPSEGAGLTVECPHCNSETLLSIPPTDDDPSSTVALQQEVLPAGQNESEALEARLQEHNALLKRLGAVADSMTIQSKQDTLKLHGDTITIQKRGWANALASGMNGDRTIQISSLTAVQMKPAGIMTGYILFSYAGSKPFMGGIWEATQDPDAFLFGSELNGEVAKFKAKVEQKMRESKRPAISNSSLADQLRSLAELKQQGVLTADEFEVAKKKLLS